MDMFAALLARTNCLVRKVKEIYCISTFMNSNEAKNIILRSIINFVTT